MSRSTIRPRRRRGPGEVHLERFDAQLEEARLAYLANDLEAARDHLERAERELLDDDAAERAEVAILLARLMRRVGDTAEARALLACAVADARLAERPDLELAAEVERGMACLDEGQVERAAELLREVEDREEAIAAPLRARLERFERSTG